MSGYPLASPGVFRSIQGEGALLGEPMTFVRLAGCSVGCPLCDTDYRVASRATAAEIASAVASITPRGGWAWITGGEPTDHDIGPLLVALDGFRVALATAGHRDVPYGVDWLSVSPHDPDAWAQMSGDELKLVPALKGRPLADFARKAAGSDFAHRFVSPCDGRPETLAECMAWAESNPGWRLTAQAHKIWGLP